MLPWTPSCVSRGRPSREHTLRTDPRRMCLSVALPRPAGTIAVASLPTAVSVGPSGCFQSHRGQARRARPGPWQAPASRANMAMSRQAQHLELSHANKRPMWAADHSLTLVRLLSVMLLLETARVPASWAQEGRTAGCWGPDAPFGHLGDCCQPGGQC